MRDIQTYHIMWSIFIFNNILHPYIKKRCMKEEKSHNYHTALEMYTNVLFCIQFKKTQVAYLCTACTRTEQSGVTMMVMMTTGRSTFYIRKSKSRVQSIKLPKCRQ